MLKRFFPREYALSIFDIDYDRLLSNGICGLIFDIDNTLVTFDIPEPPERIKEFLIGLAKKGFKVCFLSNNSEARVTLFNRSLGYQAVFKAGKPKRAGILKAAALLQETPKKLVLIGDQMFTDCWCGNRAGIYTVLVKPISDRDEWTVKLKRGVEKLVFSAYLKHTAKNGDKK